MLSFPGSACPYLAVPQKLWLQPNPLPSEQQQQDLNGPYNLNEII